MLYSISKNYPQVAANLTEPLLTAIKQNRFFNVLKLTTVLAAVVFVITSPSALAGGPAPDEAYPDPAYLAENATNTVVRDKPIFQLQPHKAVYSGNFSGINADMEQSLTRLGEQQWQLKNTASILFVGFEETAKFTQDGKQIIANQYRYTNKISKKRSSSLQFNHQNNTVTDSKKNQGPMAVPVGALDKISLEVQLRLDLVKSGSQFEHKIYDVISSGKIRQYQIKYIGEEEISVPAGTFKTLKLEQRRVGYDNKSTLLWFAPALDYMLINIRRIETDKPDINITLKSISFKP